MFKKLFLALIFLMPILSFAQGGGHVGRGRHCQMQEESARRYKYSVTQGDVAKALYWALIKLGTPEVDLSDRCTHSVKSVESMINNQDINCFDRGDDFKHGSRYKCFIQEELNDANIIEVIENIFHSFKNNYCGGDGVRNRKVQ